MQFAEIVRDHGERRKLHESAISISSPAASGIAEGDIVEKAAVIIADLRDGTLRQSCPFGSVFGELVEEMSTRAPFTPTPWVSLNAMIGGIRPGSLYTVAARSGGGKSIFGLQLALHIAELGKRVGYVSLEMTETDLLMRLISMMQGIHQGALQNHQLTNDGWESVKAAESAIGALPLEVFDRAGTRWEDIVGFANALHRKGDLGLIVIDYLGLVKSPAESKSRQQDLEDWANAGKQLAKQLGCSVLILEQLNRNMTNRPNPRPIISNLRGSAGLEHASDAVVLMHRGEKKHQGRVIKTSDVDFIVAKNRQGESGTRTLRFEGQYARITQKAHEDTALIESGEVYIMAGEPIVTVVGNLVADPEPRVSQAGKSWVTFRIASTPRVRDRQSGDWADGEALWLGCRAYGEYADNIAASLTKGMRVIVQGRLTQRSYTGNQGQQRTSLDLEVEEVGPSLRFATAAVSRAGSGPAGGGYAKTGNGSQPAYGQTEGGGYAQGQPAWGQSAGGFDDEQPF